jgi:hypothetical protein
VSNTSTKSPLPKAKVRPATPEDFDQVLPLLKQLNDTRITETVWHRLFANLWQQTDYQPGYVLDTGERLVGFMGTLYSERVIDGETHTICNLTSWIVEEDYRSSSLFLLMPIVRQKGITFTSLTSSPEAYAVYNKLGFADLDTEARVIYRNPLRSGKAYNVITNTTAMRDLLNDTEQRYLDDHQMLDCTHLLIERDGQYCYCLVEIKRGKLHLHYVSDLAFFRQHLAGFRTKLLATLGQKCLQIDERLLQNQSLMFSRKKTFTQAKQFKSATLSADQIDGLYSELLVLATKATT